MPALFNFEIHTPFRLFYSGQVQAVILTLVDGEIGVYANHAPFTAVTVSGILRIMDENEVWRSAFVSTGIFEVKKGKYVLMAESAEWPEEIDKERALVSMKQAQKTLDDVNFKFEIDKAKEKLRRADYRLKILEQTDE